MAPIKWMLLAAAALTAASAKVYVDPDCQCLRDKYGRELILHGVNVVYKVPSYSSSSKDPDPLKPLSENDIASLKRWGMNFVRLGLMWEDVEVEAGVYNETHLDVVEDLINELGENGIYTLVDAHQDAVGAEGMPNFYAKSAIESQVQTSEDGTSVMNHPPNRNYDEFSPEGQAGLQALYHNDGGLQDKFAKYWGKVSMRFKGNKHVFGYDPLNEPFPGHPLAQPRGAPSRSSYEQDYLEPMYKRFSTDQPDDIMLFGGWEYRGAPGEANGNVTPVGFETPPGGKSRSIKTVLSDHSYCCPRGGVGPNHKLGTDFAAQCAALHAERFAVRGADAKRLGVPLILSEFGACPAEDNGAKEINDFAESADKHLAGWAYWRYKTDRDLTTSGGAGFYNADGTLQIQKVQALARPFVPVAQGKLTYQHFDTGTGRFEAELTVNTSLPPSTIYLNKDFWYQHGYNLKVEDQSGKQLPPSDRCETTVDSQWVSVQVKGKEWEGKTIRFKVEPKARRI